MGEAESAGGPVRELFAYLAVRDAGAAVRFYAEVLGAEKGLALTEPGGRLAHAELRLGSALLMLTEERPDEGFPGPLALGGTPVRLHLHVDDVDVLAARAVDAGAVLLRPPTDEAHGERQCLLRDPFGHEWLLGHKLESLADEEVARRYAGLWEGS